MSASFALSFLFVPCALGQERTTDEWQRYNDLARRLGCESVIRPLQVSDTAGPVVQDGSLSGSVHRELVRHNPYEKDYPVRRLLSATAATQGRFRIGWESGDESVNFVDEAKIERIHPSHPRQAIASELWTWSNDKDWMVRDFAQVSPLPAEEVLAVRQRGVEVGMFVFFNASGEEVARFKFSGNNPFGIALPRTELIREALRQAYALFGNVVRSVELWHTHPNGNPFSLQDYLGFTTSVREMLVELLRFESLEYRILVVTKAEDEFVLYSMPVTKK